ncbi:hypothetical protein PACTADRAFT_48809 [Pachysolen tannophilus NRRL Y-2460]|uniref:Fe2OG dioxygenase domain-containing protein n=1 Tax=Pachysolen tannophilus NRRL Y-2460 TaxID=669874 RepID=A0A1E4TZ31_PACTA|nr:hypothetical protein PACTADRAFT_48809 [Pachysolen tannophilus NRRL Y-2460]
MTTATTFAKIENKDVSHDQSTIYLDNGKVIHTDSNSSVSFEDDFDSIPIVDLADMYSSDLAKRKKVAKNIFDVCTKVGFFYAINHGIPDEISENTFKWSKEFFHSLTEDQKMEVYTGLLPDSEYQGYHPFGRYNRGNRKYNDLMEAFNFTYERDFDPLKPEKNSDCTEFKNLWPSSLPGFKENMFKYHSECLKVSRTLIKIVALALDLPEDYFDEAVTTPAACMRILHYPQQDVTEDEQNGIGAHSDFEIFTLVNPGKVSGLQVLNKRNFWVKVPPIEGALVVNVADCLMRLTNDKFVSTIHRVVNNSATTRYSIPFFFGFNPNYVLNPLPTCVSEENPQKYPVTTCREYLIWRAQRAKANKKEIDEMFAQKASKKQSES